MAEDCVDHAVTLARLTEKDCITRDLRIHGYHQNAESLGALAPWGSDALKIQKIAHGDKSLSEPLHESLPYTGAEVVFAVQEEMARTVDDFLSRRARALFLNAEAAMAMAPKVAEIMAAELGRDTRWQDAQVKVFKSLAQKYVVVGKLLSH
jgi:glycerol-3-phosphate dehydrogenase